mmetsp:Transcript_54818/g.122615  ORF Transcript_54818/g.122615 Transcript_54818/m.122615 type:complete len:255 (-) Transcript_54818:297-1061(-)
MRHAVGHTHFDVGPACPACSTCSTWHGWRFVPYWSARILHRATSGSPERVALATSMCHSACNPPTSHSKGIGQERQWQRGAGGAKKRQRQRQRRGQRWRWRWFIGWPCAVGPRLDVAASLESDRCLAIRSSSAPPSRRSFTRAWPSRLCTSNSTRQRSLPGGSRQRVATASRSIAASRTSPVASSPRWISTVVQPNAPLSGRPSHAHTPRGSMAVSGSMLTPSAAQTTPSRRSVSSKNIHGSASASRAAGSMNT